MAYRKIDPKVFEENTMGKKLSRAQVEVLRTLADGPCETSVCTAHGFVGGQCAEALRKMGFVKPVRRAPGNQSNYSVEITPEGRAALTAWLMR